MKLCCKFCWFRCSMWLVCFFWWSWCWFMFFFLFVKVFFGFFNLFFKVLKLFVVVFEDLNSIVSFGVLELFCDGEILIFFVFVFIFLFKFLFLRVLGLLILFLRLLVYCLRMIRWFYNFFNCVFKVGFCRFLLIFWSFCLSWFLLLESV